MRHLLLLLFICTATLGFGQKMRFKVAGLKDTTVFLTRYYGKGLYYADTAISKSGVIEFDTKNLKPGMFALYLPGPRYFDFIVNNNEEINIETADTNLIGSMKVKKSEENKVLVAYTQFLQKQRSKHMALKSKQEGLKKEDPQYELLNKQMEVVSKEVLAYQDSMIKLHDQKLVGKIVKMSVEIKIPDAPKNENGEVIDPRWQLNYWRQHFWDNIDLNDDRLVNTAVFHQKVEQFYGKNMIVPHPDSILAVAFPFIDGLKKGSEVFKYHVDYLTNWAAKSNQMGIDKVYIMMVDRYYCSRDESGKSPAFWMTEEKLASACEDIPIKKKLVQGVVPPNVILPDTNNVWRQFMTLKSDYTILYFWDPECGHCKKTTPKLQKLYAEKLKARNVEVFAVGKATGDDYEKWKKFIKDNGLSFINVALTQKLYEAALQDARQFVPKYTNIESLNYSTTYDLYATPRIIVLDKDKKIIAKQLTISQLEDMLDRLQEVKDPVKLFPPDPEEEAH
ncbi:MAG TPA: thioredoxin-like domain-containing protein [Fluviicola sp.]|nr:thioredoxin-like domain-containing protein [Fluviicola sp.]